MSSLGDLNILQSASLCPVCDHLPVATLEDVLGNLLTFLRCPKGHPYVACGVSLIQAVNHWNYYIGCLVSQDTTIKMRLQALLNSNGQSAQSYCRYCQSCTKSKVTFKKVLVGPLQYVSTMYEQCGKCFLTKVEREVA